MACHPKMYESDESMAVREASKHMLETSSKWRERMPTIPTRLYLQWHWYLAGRLSL